MQREAMGVMRYLKRKQVCEKTGLSWTTVWRLQNEGEFPRPYRLTPKRVGWLEAEVEEWMATRPAAMEPEGSSDGGEGELGRGSDRLP